MIDNSTKICCVIGKPLRHSLSGVMYNAVYNKLGLNFIFLTFESDNLEKTMSAVKTFAFKGIAVTLPYKIDVLKYCHILSDEVKDIGAANTLVSDNGKITAYNTDYIGALSALEEVTTVKGKKVALLGAGGAAYALAYTLSGKGGKITVYNRNLDTAKRLSDKFSLEGFGPLRDQQAISKAEIIINTTPLGMKPYFGVSPFEAKWIRKDHIIFDIVYNPQETEFIKSARTKGAKIVYGYKMLLYQAVSQFKLFTGVEAPVDVMENALLKSLGRIKRTVLSKDSP